MTRSYQYQVLSKISSKYSLEFTLPTISAVGRFGLIIPQQTMYGDIPFSGIP